MTTTTDLSLTTRRTIKAPARSIYRAWLDPKMLTRFMRATDGMTVPTASADPRVGGRFDVLMVLDGREMPHGGVYTELEPDRRIAFRWESPHVSDETTVTITLTPMDGGTEVVLTHTRLPTESSRDGHLAGWTAILACLDAEVA